jgi:hypothetical protein
MPLRIRDNGTPAKGRVSYALTKHNPLLNAGHYDVRKSHKGYNGFLIITDKKMHAIRPGFSSFPCSYIVKELMTKLKFTHVIKNKYWE